MHKSALDKQRKEIVKQIKQNEASVKDYKNYIPIGNASNKLSNWNKQGVKIAYLSALKKSKLVRADETTKKLNVDKIILDKYKFPKGRVYHRKPNERYKNVIGRMKPLPDIIIEDDCESIGKQEITYNSLDDKLKKRIKSVIVKEFGGIEHLPDNINDLIKM